MANHLRLLPLIAVAVGGVIAVRAVGSIEAVPAFMKSATAWAEGAEKKTPEKAAKTPAKAGEKAGSADDTAAEAAESAAAATGGGDEALSILDAATPAAAPAPVCATSVDDLARQAGMSPSELKVIQSLAQRRTELDAREKQIGTQEQLITAAEAKLDGRIKQLTDLKTQVQALLDEANKTGDQDVARMVKVYESMKPKDAAKVFETLKDDVRLPIASKMKERNLAAVLAQMSPDKARDLTEKLSQRMKKADDLQNRLDKVNAPGAAAPAQAPAKK